MTAIWGLRSLTYRLKYLSRKKRTQGTQCFNGKSDMLRLDSVKGCTSNSSNQREIHFNKESYTQWEAFSYFRHNSKQLSSF